jgi:hypothetical protein
MAGYSGTPLFQKLGIKVGTRLNIVNAPQNYRKLLGKLPPGVKFSRQLRAAPIFIHFFTTKRSELEKTLSIIRNKMDENGVVWVSWPKKSAGIETNVTEDVIRVVALPLGFVDIKVCAVDAVWSGLKLMIRRENRKSSK